MLDALEIVTTSGIVLWSRQLTPISPAVINRFISDVFIEQRGGVDVAAGPAPYKQDKYTLRYTTAKDVGLVFVAVYQSLLHLSWVDNLLTAVKAVFLKQYASDLRKPSVTALDTRDFTPTFNALLNKLDGGAARRSSEPDSETQIEYTPPSSSASVTDEGPGLEAPPRPTTLFRDLKSSTHGSVTDDNTSADITPIATPDTSRPTSPLPAAPHLLQARSGPHKQSRRARKSGNAALAHSAPASSGDESPARGVKSGKSNTKAKRRWGLDGSVIEGEDDVELDYSAVAAPVDHSSKQLDVDQIKADHMGSRTGKGQFVLKDLDDELEAILAESKGNTQVADLAPEKDPSILNSATSRITGLFRNVIGGKTLSKQDLEQPLQQMQKHLLEKNVAREAADRLCTSVEADLLNQTTASFTSIDKTIRESMAKALTRMLTPTSSLDLLREINATITGANARPYVISIVGVNGVGKSTNLSKIAYFLLQNKYRVLVVAADTFRSGAVEQLRVHVRNLTELSRREQVGHVELFEKGYGKDAATVARDAVNHAVDKSTGDVLFDVVLIDTAGRRHNDARLMSSLTKFGQLANPDKIFMVGEALVGTDSVAQARNFAKEFVDTKGQLRNGGVGMDGFIISKCDTVGDMVGTLVSMVHATGIPIVFLGVGQHYDNLRGFNVDWAVSKLMK